MLLVLSSPGEKFSLFYLIQQLEYITLGRYIPSMIWYCAAVKYKSADLHVITCHLTIVQRNISAARLVSGGSTGGPKTTHNPIPQTKAASHKSPLRSTEDITSIPTRDLSNTPNLLGSETQHLTPLTFLLFHSPPSHKLPQISRVQSKTTQNC